MANKKLLFVALFIFSLFALLIAQFYKIQILEGDKWTKKAKGQHYFTINEPFFRGRFFSNASLGRRHRDTPQSFVVDVKKFHLHIDPHSIPEKERDKISDYLMAHLHMTLDEKMECRAQFDYKGRNRKIAMWQDKETKNAIMEWWIPFARNASIPRNALFFLNDYQRSYPFGKLLGQVLHTVQKRKDEKSGQSIPTGGLEAQFDSYLRGKPGKRRLMRSPRNSFETGEVISLPENGADVYLTINHNLQEIAESEIAKGVKKLKAKAGWAAIMDPRTGEILALAQYPFFNPSDYQRYFNDKELIQHTRVKAITDANEPGSIIKPITLAIGLVANEILKKKGEKELFDPEEMMPTSNCYFKGRKKPLKDLSFHQFLNMDMALQKSSNIYMARVYERLIERFGSQFCKSCLTNIFGFGKKTGIELPSETAGVLPTPGKKHKNGTLEWSLATPYSLAIGHNIQASSLQILRAYAVFANGGKLVRPTLIKKIARTNSLGREELLFDASVEREKNPFPQVISPSIVARVVKAMKYVTKKGGCATLADIKGYTEAGKTGTAEKVIDGVYSKTVNCSSFVGIVLVNDLSKAFLLIVTVDEPEHKFLAGFGRQQLGGKSAAPIFQEIARKALEYWGMAPDDPYGYSAGDPRHDPKKADFAIETEILNEKYNEWNRK
ncbi:MAG TPA: penicillin-binding protein 2 [Parachlamydiaceae bacterium]|nr:penicillin-binding protein 2 [Parachlamydiaceae bacterium]